MNYKVISMSCTFVMFNGILKPLNLSILVACAIVLNKSVLEMCEFDWYFWSYEYLKGCEHIPLSVFDT